MKLKVYRSKTKVRRSSGSKVSTIPVAMAEMLDIETGSTLIWELDPNGEPFMKVYLEKEEG